MTDKKIRRQILHETARMMLTGQEQNLGRARILAARKLCKGWVKPRDLPSDQEVQHELHVLMSSTSTSASRPAADRFERYRQLLHPLSGVMQPAGDHPEGDVLYHSLQVFELAKANSPYDEEFLLAALLHDVGKGIDPRAYVDSGVAALGDSIPERTRWLIENLEDGHRLLEGTIGQRAKRRLSHAEDYQDLLELVRCDRAGRRPGADVTSVDAALDFLRELSQEERES